jgi:hypothetical protein
VLSTSLELVRQLRQAGAEFDIEDADLRIVAPSGLLTEEIKDELIARKQEILKLFSESLQLLNERGVRIISRDGRTFALWRDADGQKVRDALEALGYLDVTIFYLDDPYTGIEERYWNYVPQYVREIWSSQGLLASPYERREAEAKARRINAYFNSLGPAYRTKGVTTATVLHGMLAAKKKARQ